MTLEALLEPSWGTVGAYQFDMLKKQESNATAEKNSVRRQVAKPWGKP